MTAERVGEIGGVPSDIATCMYYTGIDPFTNKAVNIAKNLRDRKLQRALMQFFKPENHFEVREALIQAGRQRLDWRVRGTHPRESTEGSDRGSPPTGERGNSERSLPLRRQPGEGRETG